MKNWLKIIELLGTFSAWWIKSRTNDEQKKEELRREVKEAIKSGDVSRINLVINKLREKNNH